VTEREKAASVIGSSFEIFDTSELIEEAHKKFVGALLRYIFDKHFLPNFLLGTHCISSNILGTPRGLTVMLPPCVIMGVIVRGSNTISKNAYRHQGCRYNYEESSQQLL